MKQSKGVEEVIDYHDEYTTISQLLTTDISEILQQINCAFDNRKRP
jgi:hypothetical protein